MSTPSLILGIVVSTLYGALFHLWKGGGPGRLFLYLILSWLGFWIGQALATQLDLNLDRLGQLHIGTATIVAVIFLFIGHWLSQIDVDVKSKSKS